MAVLSGSMAVFRDYSSNFAPFVHHSQRHMKNIPSFIIANAIAVSVG